MPFNYRNSRSFQKLWGQMQKRAKKELGPPEAREGTEGSEALRRVPGKGLFKYVKDGGKWKCSRYIRSPLTLKEEINDSIGHLRFDSGNNTRLFGNLSFRGPNQRSLRFFDSDLSHYTGFKAHATTIANVDYVLPDNKPSANRILQSDSSGNLAWVLAGSPSSIDDDTILGNISGATGAATALTATQTRTLINVENGSTADQNQSDINGLAITTTGALNSGSITSGFGNIDNGTSTLSTGEITSGAVVWAEFPFNVQNAVHNKYYFRDTDDLDDFRKWDASDADPTTFNYRNVAGSYTVPENCTLISVSGVIASQSGTLNPTVHTFTGSVTESTGDTTLASAGSVTVSISTSYVPYKFSDTYDVDLSAGDIVVPMIQSVNLGSTPDFYGSLTLKFLTR